jgi:hypothetical protein
LDCGYIIKHQIDDNIIGINVAKMNGFFVAIELNKRFKRKKLYLGLQLLYRHTVSVQDLTINPTITTRDAFSLLFKFGYCHINKKGFGIDIGSGLGVKYISSFCNKSNAYDFIEYPAVRYYNSSSGLFPAFLLIEVKLFKTF